MYSMRKQTRKEGKEASLTLWFAARICTRDTEGYQADAAFCGAPRATSVDID